MSDTTPPDPAIDEIRRVRHEISREFDNDLDRLFEVLKTLEARFKRPPVDYGTRRTAAANSEEVAGENLPRTLPPRMPP
jgi:hypothetical protein